eukprot:1188477-Prorocentrum_minimum.AAC.1
MQAETDCKRAEEEEAEYRSVEAALAAVAALRRRGEEVEVELRRTEAEVAAAKAWAESRRRAEAEAQAATPRKVQLLVVAYSLWYYLFIINEYEKSIRIATSLSN